MSVQPVSGKSFVIALDDNLTDLTIASFLVSKEGFEPKMFSTYSQFNEFLSEHYLDVKMILMDNEMPGLSGLDVVKRIKKTPSFKDIPVVMMTGDSSPETVQKSIRGGAVDYIVKPIDPMIFESKLRKHLKTEANPSKDAEWAEYKLGQIKECPLDLRVPVVLVSISELSMTLRADYEVTEGSIFVIDTAFFHDIGIRAVPLKVNKCIKIPNTEKFQLSCGILALTEGDLRKIRVFCKTLVQNNVRTA